MKQEIVSSVLKNAKEAASELLGKLERSAETYNAVFFFASVEQDFALLSELLHKAFKNAWVMGVSTSGEISE